MVMALSLPGCFYQRQKARVPESELVNLPEQIHLYPQVNPFKQSMVGVFKFSEPFYSSGIGKAAAEAVFYDLLKKGVFRYIISETEQDHVDTLSCLEIAQSKGYNLIIMGDILYCFEGSDFIPSYVNERILVIHVPTKRILWSATAKGLSCPSSSRDFYLFRTEGHPAQTTAELIEENASKFSNMLLKKPFQTDPDENNTDILSSSPRVTIEALQNEVDDLKAQKYTLEQRILEEIEKGKGFQEEVNSLSAQADHLEQQLKDEIQKGEIILKRYASKTIINIDNKICFDSGSAVLKRDAKKSLIKIASSLTEFPNNNIRIEGHTDNVPIQGGGFASNWELSSARALAVLRFLLDNSEMEPERFSAIGYGEYHPFGPNDSPKNRQLNRRVDIVIVPSSI